MNPNIPSPGRPPAGLVRLTAAAKLANLTPEMLEAGIAAKTVPLEIVRPGKRWKFVRSHELTNWLAGQLASEVPHGC